MKKNIIFFFTIILLVVGCTKEGPQGPQGPQGAQGPQGTQGPQGAQGPISVQMITDTFYVTSDDWTYVASTYGFNNTYQVAESWPELTSDYYTNGLIVFYAISEYTKGTQVSSYAQLPFIFWPSYDNSYFRRFDAEPGFGVAGQNETVDEVTFVSYDSDNYPVNPGYTVFKGVAIKNIAGVGTMSPAQKDRIVKEYLKKFGK